MSVHVAIDDPTRGCPTCDDSRASSLRWGGRGWIPVRCPDCCDHRLVKLSDLKCPECGFDLPPVEVS